MLLLRTLLLANLSGDKWNVNAGQRNFECIYGSFLFDILVILFLSNIRKLIALQLRVQERFFHLYSEINVQLVLSENSVFPGSVCLTGCGENGSLLSRAQLPVSAASSHSCPDASRSWAVSQAEG